MTSRTLRGEYLYVSTREIERLVTSLRKPSSTAPEDEPWHVSLAGAPRETVLGVVAEVESALREQSRVRQVADIGVAVGDWFESPGLPMACGVQSARRSEDSDAAVFVGKIDEHAARAESSLLLSGSADHLLDRRSIRVEDVSGDMSYPSALFALLASLSDRGGPGSKGAGSKGAGSKPAGSKEADREGAESKGAESKGAESKAGDTSGGASAEASAEDRRAPAHRGATTRAEQAREEQWLAVGYPIAQVQSSFGRRGSLPLTFLARAVKVVNFESQGLSGRWIVGAPLWVARQLPE
ncbi:MAG: hypothetical protein WB797_18590 [Nocardioides sp.]